jgi:FkbM family methyltransferase
VGALVWGWPGAERFYRSVAGRYADRLRGTDDRFRTVHIGDVRLTLDVTEFTTASLYFGNRPYEPLTTAFLQRHLRRGGVFADVGANHGYFSMFAAARVGETGRVFAFEPNPAVFDQLVQHIALNGFERRIDARRQALSNRRDSAQLFVSGVGSNSGLSTLVPDATRLSAGDVWREGTVRVETDAFDRWLADSAVDRVDVVKIDVEGGEDLIVEGMSGALASRRIGAVVCETHAGSRSHQLLSAAASHIEPLDVGGALTNFAYLYPAP